MVSVVGCAETVGQVSESAALSVLKSLNRCLEWAETEAMRMRRMDVKYPECLRKTLSSSHTCPAGLGTVTPIEVANIMVKNKNKPKHTWGLTRLSVLPLQKHSL